MSSIPYPLDNVAGAVNRLTGRVPDDPDLQKFLTDVGAWPLSKFPADEFNLYFEDKQRGFCLMFEDAATVDHPRAASKAPRVPLLVGCYFYSQGKDGYQQFDGALPHGVAWADTPASLPAKLGEPANKIMSKKTGVLVAHCWDIDGLLLTVGYNADAIEDVFLGIG